MAESTLSIDYATLSREVGHFLGWGRDRSTWTNTQKQDFDDIVKRALRLFYFPPMEGENPYYEWTFLRKTNTITYNTSASNAALYDLPDDFGGTILDRSVTYPKGSNIRMLTKVPESVIRQNYALDDQTGTPKYFAVRNKTHVAANGQRWEMLVYPLPKENTTITFRYVFVPDIITNTAIYPVGGAQYSEVILAAFMSAAEYKQDDEPTGAYTKKFEELLKVAMRNDMQQKANDRGGDA